MKVLAMILAGGRGSRLDILSEKRVKPSVPFAGKFRIIDFALSNCSNSGIYDIALSLNEHIGSGKPWDFDRRDSSITMLQPHEKLGGNSWYQGTADAIRQNIDFIKNKNPMNFHRIFLELYYFRKFCRVAFMENFVNFFHNIFHGWF